MTPSKLMEYFRRLMAHVRHGTVQERIRWEWRRYIEPKRLAWWQSQIGKRDFIEVTIQRGIRMRLYLDSKLSELIYCTDFERTERHFLNAFLKPGDIFIDIGANIGLFSLIAASRVGRWGKVYAFEPTRTIFDRLNENIRLNHYHNIIPFQMALSDKAGSFPFYLSTNGYDAWNSFAPSEAKGTRLLENVRCETWDAVASTHQLVGRVTMMKMDVEGWEHHVLSGGVHTLSRQDSPVLQVEFTDKWAQAAGTSCREVYHFLEKLGYRMFVYDRATREIIPDPLRESYPDVNLIAAKYPEVISERLKRN